MPTDSQGRLLSDDGFYYWDGSAWQLVQQSADAPSASASPTDASESTPTAEDFKRAMNVESSSQIGAVSE